MVDLGPLFRASKKLRDAKAATTVALDYVRKAGRLEGDAQMEFDRAVATLVIVANEEAK